MKGGDDTVRPLCADNFAFIGCHTKMDQTLDDFWTYGKKQALLNTPVDEAWKSGDLDEAMRLIGEWRNDI